MTLKVEALINNAASTAGVKATGQNLSGDLFALYLNLLNGMIQEWRNDGINLGIDELVAGSTVYINPADHLVLQYNLATLIYENSGRPVNPAVYTRANQMYNGLLARYQNIADMEVPQELYIQRAYNVDLS